MSLYDTGTVRGAVEKSVFPVCLHGSTGELLDASSLCVHSQSSFLGLLTDIRDLGCNGGRHRCAKVGEEDRREHLGS
jgi:hypothetical protein